MQDYERVATDSIELSELQPLQHEFVTNDDENIALSKRQKNDNLVACLVYMGIATIPFILSNVNPTWRMWGIITFLSSFLQGGFYLYRPIEEWVEIRRFLYIDMSYVMISSVYCSVLFSVLTYLFPCVIFAPIKIIIYGCLLNLATTITFGFMSDKFCKYCNRFINNSN